MALLKEVKGPNGEKWDNIVDTPEDVYEECRGDYPDLMVYFDNLSWHPSACMGHKSMYFYENSTGQDDAIHDWDGIYVVRFPRQHSDGRASRNILDIALTILEFMGILIPEYMNGTAIRS